jgi:nucleoside phosphorylase
MTRERPRIEDERIDVLLVTAISCEFAALKTAAHARALMWKKVVGQTAEYRVLGVVGGQRVAAIQLASMGSFSVTGSAFTCNGALVETSASSVIAVGIAFGVDESQQSVGDLMVPDEVLLYDECTVHDDANESLRFEYAPQARVAVPKRWLPQIRGAYEGLAYQQQWNRPLWGGRFLAGSARIESRRYRDELCRRVAGDGAVVIGGEMEAAGIAAACAARGATWAVVKAVADFATRESRARIHSTRQMAATRAAQLTLETLQNSTNLGGSS